MTPEAAEQICNPTSQLWTNCKEFNGHFYYPHGARIFVSFAVLDIIVHNFNLELK